MTKSAFHKDYLRKRTRPKVTSYSRDYDKSILRQPFGYCAVQVEVIQSKGTDDEKKSYTASNHSKRSSTAVTRAFTTTIRTEYKYYFITKSSITPLSH